MVLMQQRIKSIFITFVRKAFQSIDKYLLSIQIYVTPSGTEDVTPRRFFVLFCLIAASFGAFMKMIMLPYLGKLSL